MKNLTGAVILLIHFCWPQAAYANSLFGEARRGAGDGAGRHLHADALIKQAADYFRLGERELTKNRGPHRQERALVMELLHRYSGPKQRMIAQRFGELDEGLVSRDLKAIRKKIETEPTIRKWFQDLATIST